MQKLNQLIPMAIIGAMFLPGCSVFRSPTQVLNVACNPQDAVLLVNGENVSNPAIIETARNKSVVIQCSKTGYHPSMQTVNYHFNNTGMLDTIGGVFLLVPLIGVVSPGAWSLNQTDIFIQLYSISDKEAGSLF